MATKKNICRLPPFQASLIASIDEVKQKAGWEITAFNLPAAWDDTEGEGVKVAIIDTGCDLDHPDLVGNLLPGINMLDQSKPPHDDNMHGTHVTGIVCASNNEIGVVGVAPKCKVMPIKVLDANGAGDMEVVAAGIQWALANGADIIGMSLGCPRPVQQVRRACQLAQQAGVPVFCAAGNAGKTTDVFYPACYPEAIAIGSIDQNFDRSAFSNTGENLDFMAPGGKILSTIPDNWYAVLSGTSMACPFAVGVAALLLSFVRKHNLNIPLRSSKDYIEALRAYTTPISDPRYADQRFFQGFGIIDPRKFDEWCEKQEQAEQPVPTVTSSNTAVVID